MIRPVIPIIHLSIKNIWKLYWFLDKYYYKLRWEVLRSYRKAITELDNQERLKQSKKELDLMWLKIQNNKKR